jgi:hypothetical protein
VVTGANCRGAAKRARNQSSENASVGSGAFTKRYMGSKPVCGKILRAPARLNRCRAAPVVQDCRP